MSDPKDWKIGDIVRPRMYCPECGVDDVEYSIACGPLNGMFMFRSRGLPVWRSPHQLIFVRTAEAERERIAPAPVSLRTMKTDVFPITHDEFTVTFPPTAKTVNVSVHPETKCSVNGTVVQEGLESPKDAKPHPFYVGQRLICVDDSSCSSITNGKEYYVTGCGDDFVRLNGLIGSWSGWRFKPAPFKVGDKVKAIKPLPCEDIKDFTVTSVADRRHGGQWLRFDGKCSGEPCGSFQLVTPAPEKPEPRFKPGDRVCCVNQIGAEWLSLSQVDRAKVDQVNRGESLIVRTSSIFHDVEIVSFESPKDISFGAKNFRKVDSFMFGDYVKCISLPGKRVNPDYADFKVGEVCFVTDVGCGQGWIQLQGKTSLYYDPAHFVPCETPKAPEPAPFRVGDIVTCVDATAMPRNSTTRLVQGGDYVIAKSFPDAVGGPYVTVTADGSTYSACGTDAWAARRFVHKVIKKPAQATFCGVDMGKAEVESSPKWYDMGNRRAYRDAFVAAFEKAMKNAPPTKIQGLPLADRAKHFADTRAAILECAIREITPADSDPREWLKAQQCEMVYPPRSDSDVELCQIRINGIAKANVTTDYKNMSCRWELIQPPEPPKPQFSHPFKVGDVVICVKPAMIPSRSLANPGDIHKVTGLTYDNCLEFAKGRAANSACRFKLYEPKFSPMDLVECIEDCAELHRGGIYEVSRSSGSHTHVKDAPAIGFPSTHFKIHKTADQRMVEAIEAGKVPDIADSVQDVRDKMIEAAKRPVGHIIGHPEQTVGRFESGRLYPTSPQAYFAMQEASSKGGYFQITWT